MKKQFNLKLLKSKKDIAAAVEQLAKKINKDYKNSVPLLIGVLKGSFIFMADLIRQLSINIDISFVELSSYENSRETSGEVKYVKRLDINLKNRDVLIVEDIIDTGITIASLLNYLEKRNPSSIRICSLTSKPSRRKKEVKIDYLGFKVPNKFIVGYGLDYKEKYRNLPEIYFLEDE
jgi:hypoxanthine phosphoribosyltransferase